MTELELKAKLFEVMDKRQEVIRALKTLDTIEKDLRKQLDAAHKNEDSQVRPEQGS